MDFEWEHRRRLAAGAQPSAEGEEPSQWARCGGDEVVVRNRYANVDPWQSNRVKLQVPDGHSDYINASPIVLESTASRVVTKFIATQARSLLARARHVLTRLCRAPRRTPSPISGA